MASPLTSPTLTATSTSSYEMLSPVPRPQARRLSTSSFQLADSDDDEIVWGLASSNPSLASDLDDDDGDFVVLRRREPLSIALALSQPAYRTSSSIIEAEPSNESTTTLDSSSRGLACQLAALTLEHQDHAVPANPALVNAPPQTYEKHDEQPSEQLVKEATSSSAHCLPNPESSPRQSPQSVPTFVVALPTESVNNTPTVTTNPKKSKKSKKKSKKAKKTAAAARGTLTESGGTSNSQGVKSRKGNGKQGTKVAEEGIDAGVWQEASTYITSCVLQLPSFYTTDSHSYQVLD